MSADRDLLYGLIALQNHFIDHSDLLAAFHVWCDERSRSLVQILRDRKALSEESARVLESIVRLHLDKFGDDPAKSLAALGSLETARDVLARIANPEVQASLGHLGGKPPDVFATRMPTASEAILPQASRFRVLRFHARGGLGQVSVAIDKELGREVAFKEIHETHADRADSRVRFKVEAEITGGLEHPGIVPVYSLGHDATGRPYYAMRFIRGDNLQAAIKRFRQDDADPKRDPGERALALRKLLGRFLDVCNAMAYAHSRGVLHRDLKPGNIMLGDYGETIVVDWGLAKIIGKSEVPGDEPSLQPASAIASTETEAGTVVGTPAYMSPEQAEGRLEALGPRSDVYSLGATLYELLTGHAPYEGRTDEIVAQISRGAFTPPRHVDPRIPVPLESICLKAMKVDRLDRYPTARALADDIEHWLADEPISAHPESLGSRVARWARRHRAATVSGAAALFAVCIVSIAAYFEVHRALVAEQDALTGQLNANIASERDRVRAEKREELAVQAIRKFELAVIDNPQLKYDAPLKPLRDSLLKEPLIFSKSLRKLLQEDTDPRPTSLERLAEVCFALARTTNEIGNRQDALEAYQESQAIRERLIKDDPSTTEYQSGLAMGYNNIGNLQAAMGQNEAAIASYQQAADRWTRLLAVDSRLTGFQNSLGGCYTNIGNLQSAIGQNDAANASYHRALEIHERLVQENTVHPEFQNSLASDLNNLGILQRVMGQLDLARNSYERAIAIRERLVRADPSDAEYQSDLAASHFNIGNLQRVTGHAEQAVESYRRSLQIREKLAAQNPSAAFFQHELATTHNNIGILQREMAQSGVALISYESARAIWERLVTENPSINEYQNSLATTYGNIATIQRANGDFDSALKSHEQSINLHERLVKQNPAVTDFQAGLAASHNNVAILLATLGRYDEARQAHDRAITIRERLAGENPAVPDYQSNLAGSLNNLGLLQSATGQNDAALKSHERALAICERLTKDNPAITEYADDTAMSHNNIGNVLTATGKNEAAVESYRQAIAIRERLVKENPTAEEIASELAESVHNLGNVQRVSGQYDAAAASFERAIAVWQQLSKENHLSAADRAQLARTHYHVARTFALQSAATKDPAKAKKLADGAMESIHKAEATGFADWKDVAENKDFESLRSRTDFKDLLKLKASQTSK